MTADEIQQFLQLIEAGEQLVAASESDFRAVERAAAGREDHLVIWTCAAQFQWLREKLNLCWLERPESEAALLRLKPDAVRFGAIDFERLVQAVLGIVEGRRYKETATSHDDGIDLINRVRMDVNIEAWATTVVQCKLYRGFVPTTALRDFFGVMVANVATGLFFTTGKLTSQGKRFLPHANNSPMANRFHLIDWDGLKKLLKICDRLAEMIMDPQEIPADEFRAEATMLRDKARGIIYSKTVSVVAPVQRCLF